MIKQICVNLAVKDLPRSKEFFEKIGYTVNPQLTNENAACIVLNESICAMLLTHDFFKTFTDKEITDTSTSTEALLALAVESKEEVDELMQKVLAAGGQEPRPAQDYGFMYGRDFEDLDGHIWEVFWMNPAGPQ